MPVITACHVPGCPHAGVRDYRGRCALHRQTQTQRGYGGAHQRERRALSDSLPTYCAYGCGTWLTSDSAWVAAHVIDGVPSAGYAIACQTCNARAKVR